MVVQGYQEILGLSYLEYEMLGVKYKWTTPLVVHIVEQTNHILTLFKLTNDGMYPNVEITILFLSENYQFFCERRRESTPISFSCGHMSVSVKSQSVSYHKRLSSVVYHLAHSKLIRSNP